MRSEYTVYEQLSKYYLFVIILTSLLSYKTSNDPIKIKISICFFLLGLTMYLSESNMIREAMQPIFGFIILIFTYYLLLGSRSWLILLLLSLGFFVIFCGVLADFVSEHEFVRSYLSQPIANILSTRYEEIFDFVGIGFVCISVIICFLDDLKIFIRNNIMGTLCMLITSGMITVGNGFLHYQYRPGLKTQFVALIMTIIGFLGLVLTNRYINKENATLTLINKEYFYFFIFSFFVVLPTVYRTGNIVVSLIIWLPTIIFMGIYLYYRHPLL